MIVGNGIPIAEHVKLTCEVMLNLSPPDIVRFVGLTIKYKSRMLNKRVNIKFSLLSLVNQCHNKLVY